MPLAQSTGVFDGAGRIGLIGTGQAGLPACVGLKTMVKTAQRHQVARTTGTSLAIRNYVVDVTATGVGGTAGVSTGRESAEDLVDDGLTRFVGAGGVGAGVLVTRAVSGVVR